MRKLTYLFVAVVLGLASCTSKGYTITGTLEGSADGDTVFMMEQTERQFLSVDTAVIAKGIFTFTGVQDSVVNRYLVCRGEDDLQPAYVDFFLENGSIKVKMIRTEGGSVVSGTPINDAYQAFKNNLQAVFAKQRTLMEEMTAAAPEEQEAKATEAKALDKEIVSVMKEAVNSNKDTPLGVFLLNTCNYYMEDDDIEQLISILPAQYQNNPNIVELKNRIEQSRGTDVGQRFADLELKSPEGNPVKLSDYAGKGKLVLVDFWASWCSPCRNEMPKLVEAYAKYKDKNFEIVGVSLDQDAESWKKGLEELNMTWPQMSDLNYWNSEAAKIYAIRGIPHVVLIDGEGVIVSRGLHGEELQNKLAELLQ
ncbi:MAG: AhpC/TSA family protein [Mediterranea sp.]|jgi:peroxiredoxin|nr:AhpC/TSA family protein [Mediterranea sp.]